MVDAQMREPSDMRNAVRPHPSPSAAEPASPPYPAPPPADSSPHRISVRLLRDADGEMWTRFVAAHPDATLYHTLQWRDVVHEAFGHRALYLTCTTGTEISGVLPLFEIRHPLLGSKLISLPYDVGSGGALTMHAGVERALLERAIELAREIRANYLEVRCGTQRPVLDELGMQRSEPVLVSEMLLDGEEQVRQRVASDHRKAVRKAETRGITVREATSLEDFCRFYEVYLRVFRDFGTPPYGTTYFPTLWRQLFPSRRVRLLLAFHAERCVGGLLLFCWGRNLVSKFAACLPEVVPLRAYAALYWQAILLGLAEGYHRLSWGTSSRSQTGLIEFKERWGALTVPAAIYALPIRRPVPSLERYYDSEGLLRRLWRFVPLPATRWIGAPLNRWFC
jgi:FemAB-related protein (PEP-CTERM system-associated)